MEGLRISRVGFKPKSDEFARRNSISADDTPKSIPCTGVCY